MMDFYLHDYELCRSPPDASFIDMLKQNGCLAGPHFSPPTIVEVFQDYVANFHKLRLHLIVVHLWRPWKYNTARAKEVTDQLFIRDCENTRRVSPFRPDGPEPPLRCRRFFLALKEAKVRVNRSRTSLPSDAEQYERMQASYVTVGRDFKDQEDFIASEYRKLQRLELVPERWPLARLFFSLQKCVDHLDRVLAGCCWEVYATRADPKESLSSLRQVSKCLTMMLAIYLAKDGCHPSGYPDTFH